MAYQLSVISSANGVNGDGEDESGGKMAGSFIEVS
jgi:hypothetical protein